MQNISRWPIDVSNYIFTLAKGEPENLALVSRDWSDVIRKLADLFFSKYEKNEFLMPYTKLAKQIQPIAPIGQEQDQYSIRRVNIVFQVVVNNANPQKLLIKPNMKNLSVGYLQDAVKHREIIVLTQFAHLVSVNELNILVSEASAKLKTSRLPGQPRGTSPEHKQKGTKV
jgi:hypothetical protein